MRRPQVDLPALVTLVPYEVGEGGKIVTSQLVRWILAAAGASLLLGGVLVWDYSTRARWGNFRLGGPQMGEGAFERKGCTHCHAIDGNAGKVASDLGAQSSRKRPE